MKQKSDNIDKEKNNFLARIMGLFGEDITRCWLENKNCPFENFGRPTVYIGNKKKVTLDFLLKYRNSNNDQYFLVEQKNLFAYKDGNLRTIENIDAFKTAFKKWSDNKSKKNQAWREFMSYNKHKYNIKTEKVNNVKADGTILIWSDIKEQDERGFTKNYGFSKVIGLTSIINDLNEWRDENYQNLIHKKKQWIDELFDELKGNNEKS